jgi:hypothetical protein
MRIFSTEILGFFKKLGIDAEDDIAMVPKSTSCGNVGDFLIFRYPVGTGPGSRQQRFTLIVKPIVKIPGTQNELLTVVKVPLASVSSASDLENLYTSRSKLAEDSYRTYILSKIVGPLFRLKRDYSKETI